MVPTLFLQPRVNQRTDQPAERLLWLFADQRFDGNESANVDSQESDTGHQRHHTQGLNAGRFKPPHGGNPDDEEPQRGSDVRQQRALIRQLGPLPS